MHLSIPASLAAAALASSAFSAHFAPLTSGACGARGAEGQTPEEPVKTRALFEFPAGKLADAVRALDPHATAHDPPADMGHAGQVPGAPKDAWSKPETWNAWSDVLTAEADAAAPDPERRARLALLALEQKRFADSWKHVAAAATGPAGAAWLAALLPRFLPGVPPGTVAGVGGLAGALPDGVLLTPAVPPPNDEASGRFHRSAMRVNEVHVGAAVIALTVAFESEGVQIDVHHVSGPKALLSIVIPEPEDFVFANEYVDWYRQDEMRVPHALEVKPGDEDHVLYGRFEPRPLRAPTKIPNALPAQLTAGRLWLVIPKDDPDKALHAAIARALSSKALGIECALREPAAKIEGWSGISVDLTQPAERAPKLVWLASAVERYLLGEHAATPR